MTTKIRADKVTRDESKLVKCKLCLSTNTATTVLKDDYSAIPVIHCRDCHTLDTL
jgi:Pyruvate/2-oxoacid:ferredoxin oxidoreductase delta subunit